METSWRVLNSGSNVRVLAKIKGMQIDDTEKDESTTESGLLVVGVKSKDDGTTFGKLATVVQVSGGDVDSLRQLGVDVSDELDGIKIGDEIIIGPKSGRSAIRDDNGESLYVLNRDEIWGVRSK